MDDKIYLVWSDGELETATADPKLAYEVASDVDAKVTVWRNGKADATYTAEQFAEYMK